ncbi:MFS transporter [Phenylobacterium sp.]|uniref:MFS transporter n=1 Tax=Phenylobacterium sp. TaxID=1871053 RepID=UPI0035B40322
MFSSPVLIAVALETPWRVFLPSFFSAQLGLQLGAVAALLTWIRLFDVVSDPAVGWLSDTVRVPFGRRRFWMALGAPLIMLGAWMVFFAQPGAPVAALAAACVVLHLGYSLVIVPHGGWGLEISSDPHERTRVMGAKVWFGALGAPLIVLAPAVMERMGVGDQAARIGAMGLVLIVLTALTVGLTLARIPEVDELAPAPKRAAASPLRSLGRQLRNPALLRILALYSLLGVSEAASSAVFVFFAERVLGLDRSAGGLLLIQSLVALVTVPVWVMISRRMGKRRTMSAVLLWQLVTAPIPLLLPAGRADLLIGFLVARALAWGADYMLLRAMVADVSEAEAARSGERQSSSYYALFNVSMKLAAALGVGAALGVLSSVGFDPRGGATPAAALGVVRWIYCLPSIVAAALGLVLMATFRDADRDGRGA